MTINSANGTWALVLNGLGLWAVAGAILWTGHQTHTVYLASAPKGGVLQMSMSMTDPVVVSTGTDSFTMSLDNSAALDLNLHTPDKGGIDLSVNSGNAIPIDIANKENEEFVVGSPRGGFDLESDRGVDVKLDTVPTGINVNVSK